MALILQHLRRIILLLSVVYLTGAVFRRLINDRHHSHVLQLNGSQKISWAKPLHFQWWAYIYTCYGYAVLVNYINDRRLTNLIEFLLN